MAKKLNTTQSALLESQVKEFIGSAKTKIADLKRDITLLEKEKDDSQRALDDTRRRKQEIVQENQGTRSLYLSLMFL